MMLRINDEAPNFTAETSQGTVNFHEWIGNGWAILFSHPKDFTPVCTTDLGYMAGLQPEFQKRNCKIIGLSVDPVSSHSKWAVDIEETQGHKANYPMIGDPELKVAKLYDMLPADSGNTSERRTAATTTTVRTVFLFAPATKIKLILSYSLITGTNAVIPSQRDTDQYIAFAAQAARKIKHVFRTHLHADFVAGHLELRDHEGAAIYLGCKPKAKYAFTPLGDGEVLAFGRVRLK